MSSVQFEFEKKKYWGLVCSNSIYDVLYKHHNFERIAIVSFILMLSWRHKHWKREDHHLANLKLKLRNNIWTITKTLPEQLLNTVLQGNKLNHGQNMKRKLQSKACGRGCTSNFCWWKESFMINTGKQETKKKPWNDGDLILLEPSSW